MKRLLAIGMIWIGCALAWVILGSTVMVRSGESTSSLSYEVGRLWGQPNHQGPPTAAWSETVMTKEKVTTYDPAGRPIESWVERPQVMTHPVALAATDADVALALEHRRKGLMWFPTYDVSFDARYSFLNESGAPRRVEMIFPLARDNAGYDGFQVLGAEGKPIRYEIQPDGARWSELLAAGERREYRVTYRTRGTSTWHYDFTQGTGQVKDFTLDLKTDFANIDFPAGTISPSSHAAADGKWNGTWRFESLIASAPIGVELPQRLNPGPLASKITFFAPVGLLFFFFVVAVLAAAQGRDMHPLNYFFFGCAFFAFHLLFAYLVDHLTILASFAISSAVSIFLVISYARLFVGWKFAVREMGLSQLIYLVLFSYTFFWTGFTGLAITIGAILTLFVMMQFTGRVSWGSVAAPPATPGKTPLPAA